MDTNDIYPASASFDVITPLVQTTNWEVSRASVKGWLIQGVIFNLVTFSKKNWNQSVTKYQISWKVNFVNFFEDESNVKISSEINMLMPHPLKLPHELFLNTRGFDVLL